MTDATITDIVTAGAEWLDQHKPGWINLINLETLDMEKNCVLDQVFAAEATKSSCYNRSNGDVDGFLWALDNLVPSGDFIILGFGCRPGLKQGWTEYITNRRNA